MNTARILEMADIIETGRETIGFNMVTYGTDLANFEAFAADGSTTTACGTAGCIAGWTYCRFGKGRAKVFNPRRALGAGEDRVFDAAAAALGLSGRAAEDLFLPVGVKWLAITPKVAAAALRRLAATGKVVWA
jgi:hypothetical protein